MRAGRAHARRLLASRQLVCQYKLNAKPRSRGYVCYSLMERLVRPPTLHVDAPLLALLQMAAAPWQSLKGDARVDGPRAEGALKRRCSAASERARQRPQLHNGGR